MSQPAGPDNEAQGESDVGNDDKVASSRAGKKGGGDGSYVGRTFNDESFDTGQTGAEARAEAGE